MCWVCDSKSSVAETYWANKLGLMAHFGESSDKWSDALPFDGVGDKLGSPALDLLITVDTIPGDTGTTATIEVNGEHIISTIDTIGDEDYFQVEFEAGKTYEIGQYAYIGGPSGLPLSDAYIEIYDSAGNLIVSADGGGPNTPSGLDALLSFTAETDGTYFINARSYDNLAENGTTGDEVGDYELFVDLAPEGEYVYKPYYDVDNPLYALDWGTQVDGSSRNPDGEEGPRETGNDFTGAAYNPYGIEGKTVITYYFAKQGDVFISEDPANPGLENIVAAGMRDFEISAFESAMGEFAEVADVVYVEVDNRNEADFIYITYDGTPNVGVLGRMSPPDEQNEGQAEFNRNGPGWNAQNLVKGGFSWVTLTHELGHGMGMAHPHDNGGRSGIMRGVEAEGTAFDYTTGDFDLNQGIFTMMSYEDGWQTSPYGNAPTQSGYGYNGSLAAFDIAVIQDKYGVNEDTATGDDVYRMKDVNASGTYYESIWDAAGIDVISYGGARNSVIDLRDATLAYEAGGGGRVSYAHGIFGGFTIANSVTIENARSGAGNDVLIGNNVRNVLIANDGNDTLNGMGGADGLYGGNGGDTLFGASGHDVLYGGANNDSLFGQNGDDRLTGEDGNDTVLGGDGNDRVAGGSGNDVLSGNIGDDALLGELGRDVIAGGSGADIFFFGDGDSSSVRAEGDVILDFSSSSGDQIHLGRMDADSATGADDAFSFIGTDAFSGSSGELRYEVVGGNAFVQGDTDGDGAADFFIRVDNVAVMAVSDFAL